MTQKRETQNNIIEHTTSRKKLIFRESFKKTLSEQKGSIHIIRKLLRALKDAPPGMFAKDATIALTVEQHTERSDIYLLLIGDHRFYLKIQKQNIDRPFDDFGYSLVKNMEAVKKCIKEFPWARVIEFELGYTDKEKNNYYIAEWIPNLIPLEDFMKGDDFLSLPVEKRIEIKSRILFLMDKLRNFRDVQRKNIYCDPKNGDFIIFDLMGQKK
ncbi:hypothetical protein HY621_04065 [Candidatus Uhrbacteria bacterium]|nr:hypothetical protein [Candidatus Uhrbacteria bacterium]